MLSLWANWLQLNSQLNSPGVSFWLYRTSRSCHSFHVSVTETELSWNVCVCVCTRVCESACISLCVSCLSACVCVCVCGLCQCVWTGVCQCAWVCVWCACVMLSVCVWSVCAHCMCVWCVCVWCACACIKKKKKLACIQYPVMCVIMFVFVCVCVCCVRDVWVCTITL